MTTSAEVRTRLIEALQLDLVGPTADDIDHAEEILPQAPSLWYLTGFLVPYEASFQQRSDDTGDDELDQLSRTGTGDDEAVPEAASARKAFFPSSMGLSFLVPQNTTELDVTVQWGDYCPVPVDEEEEKKAETGLQSRTSKPWQRTPRQVELKVPLRLSSNGKEGIHKFDIPDSGGLQLVLTSRSVLSPNCLPSGTCSIALFLVNSRRPAVDAERDTGYIFQAKLTVGVAESFVPRPNPRGESGDDWDESVADLQYRDEYEYAVGHNVSAVAHLNPDNSCNKVCTAWMPTADVEKVIAAEVQGVELGMEAIATSLRQRSIHDTDKSPDEVSPPKWRPFQLAFGERFFSGEIEQATR